MYFRKKTSVGGYDTIVKLLIKIILLFLVLFLLVILIDRINFPYPHKKIEKTINNEKIKVVK
tara:strand:+ start:186 stop:371 length:186 start_codon:yes stop_codon:yes gene_type:complete